MWVLDWLRGFYVRSPRWVRECAAPLLALVPMQYRYGRTYSRFRRLIVKSQSDAELVVGFQTRRMQQIVRACVGNSSFYRERVISTFGQMPDWARFSPEDLQQLPILNKEDVREIPERLLLVDRSRADLVSTSGSSGKPLSFYLDKDRSVREWAFVTHIWSQIGYRSEHRRAVLRGVSIPKADVQPWEYDPAMRELRFSPFHLVPDVMDRYLDLVHQHRINFVHGYPSAITILASHALRRGWQAPDHLMGVLPISETLFLHQRETIRSAFGQIPVMPFYGLSEKVAIAGEVQGAPDTYEFEPLYGITELVDDSGNPVTTVGESGRIVSTGLLNESMPLLRYDTGDRGILVQASAPENCFRLQVRDIRSRWGQEFLLSKTGALVSISAINIHSHNYARIREFQFYQDTPGEAAIRVVPSGGQQYPDIEPFLREIQEKVGSGIAFRLEMVDSLHSNTRGKRGFIVQKLDLQPYLTIDGTDVEKN